MNSVFENVFALNPYQQHLLAVGTTNAYTVDGRVIDPEIFRKMNDIRERAKAKAKEIADHVRRKYHEAHSHVKDLVDRTKKHIVERLAPRWVDALKNVDGLLENVSKAQHSLDVFNEVLTAIGEKRRTIKKKMYMSEDEYKKFKAEIRTAQDKVNEVIHKLNELNAHNKNLMDMNH